MKESKFVRCGEVLVNEDYYDVICDTDSGDVILCDEVNGNYVISEITTMSPIYMTPNACEKIRNELRVVGVIATDDYLYVVNNEIVQALEYGTNKVMAEFPLSADIVYEGDVNE